MRNRTIGIGIALAGLVALLGATGAATEPKGHGAARSGAAVAYPKDYRSWKHVKSMLIQEGHALYGSFGGLHHLYANDKALKGYASGKFADGSVIVFDLLEAQAGGNAITEGPRKVLGVMVKDAKAYPATGGWGFEGFVGGDPSKRAVKDMTADCYSCHASEKSRDYVFSLARD